MSQLKMKARQQDYFTAHPVFLMKTSYLSLLAV